MRAPGGAAGTLAGGGANGVQTGESLAESNVSRGQGEFIDTTTPVVADKKPGVCTGVVMEPETIVSVTPVTMYLVLDNSKSMVEGAKNGVTKWDHAITAITEFVGDATSAGIGVGIQYFNPAPPQALVEEFERTLEEKRMTLTADQWDDYEKEFHYNVDKCDGVAHAESAVPFGRLPAVADAIVASLASTDPNGGTPSVGALTGGVNFCADFQQKTPGEQCVVVFVTDGQPNGCGLSLSCHAGFTPDSEGHCVDPMAASVLVPIVQGARDNAGVLTYTVGMEGVVSDGFELLNRLAAVGGSDCTPGTPGDEACDVTQTGSAGLLEALNKIRDTVVQKVQVPCTWAVPPPPDGQRLDPSLVNVDVSIKEQVIELGQVGSEAECANVDGGWYYDTPVNPTEIRTCQQTCDVVEANPDEIRVSIELGCATKLARAK